MTPSVVREPSAQLIDRAIEGADYWRGSPLRLGEPPGHKEWLHFCVYGSDIDVLVNFSVVDDLSSTQDAPREIARLTCLVHSQGGWDGDVIGFDSNDVAQRRGYISLEFGKNCVHFRNGVYYIKAALPERRISMELILTPAALPSPANNIDVEDGPAIHWVVVPKLRAKGLVRVGNAIHRLEDAPAYHDHNWGHFRWGRNFAWEWGYGLPRDNGSPWSIVFVRLSDRGHSQTLMQALFVWRDGRQHRVFRDNDLRVRHVGLLRPARLFKLPRVMALVSPGSATDIPARLILEAEGGGDEMHVEFVFEDVAQVILPNDDDEGITAINEVNASYELEGVLGGESVRVHGRAVVEFLSH